MEKKLEEEMGTLVLISGSVRMYKDINPVMEDQVENKLDKRPGTLVLKT